MAKDKYKLEFAKAIEVSFKELFAEEYRTQFDSGIFREEFIYKNLEKPKDPTKGRFAFPIFRYVKQLGVKPEQLAENIAKESKKILENGTGSAVTTSSQGGFINAKIDIVSFASETIKELISLGSKYGSSSEGKDKTILIEYSSPNIAKPFGVGHLRSTVIGNALKLIFNKLGYPTEGINFLGDWGTQFGKMIVAYRKWGENKPVEDLNIKELLDLYVKFHLEADKDDSLNKDAREAFKKLEQSVESEIELWKQFKDISVKEFTRIYKILGVVYDETTSESFLNKEMESAIERFERANLTTISDGALIVDLNDDRLPPVLLRKSDGATLYATRDLAGLIYRWDRYKFSESLYVVGSAQADHFNQAFKAIELLEEAENIHVDERMSGRVKHIQFGWVRFGDMHFSTRKGNVILLEELLQKAVTLAMEIISDKNPDLFDGSKISEDTPLENLPQIAQDIGVGAVIFSQLWAKRQTDIQFDWDTVLSFDGGTGPYLQYSHARLSSLLRKFGNDITTEFDFELLNNKEEERLVELLADYPAVIQHAAKDYEPFFVVRYLLKIATAFNTFYQRKTADFKIIKIIVEGNEELTMARMSLVKAVQIVLKDGLNLLGIKAPEEM